MAARAWNTLQRQLRGRFETSSQLCKRCYAWQPSSVEYKQGQLNAKQRREYFYYVDHNGYLYLDDARMKNFTSAYKGQAMPVPSLPRPLQLHFLTNLACFIFICFLLSHESSCLQRRNS